MTHPEFFIKENDTSPAIESELQDGAGNSVDIRGYNKVSFYMKPKGGDTVKVSDDDSGNVSVQSPSNGRVKYDWASGDTDETGRFQAEWEVEYVDGTVETYPNTGYISVRIIPQIA